MDTCGKNAMWCPVHSPFYSDTSLVCFPMCGGIPKGRGRYRQIPNGPEWVDSTILPYSPYRPLACCHVVLLPNSRGTTEEQSTKWQAFTSVQVGGGRGGTRMPRGSGRPNVQAGARRKRGERPLRAVATARLAAQPWNLCCFQWMFPLMIQTREKGGKA